MSFNRTQFMIWLGVLVAGLLLGLLRSEAVDAAANVVARIYTRLFQMLAVPTIALAVITTLASFGKDKGMGRIFSRSLVYTLTTTFLAAAVGLLFYILFKPSSLLGLAAQRWHRRHTRAAAQLLARRPLYAGCARQHTSAVLEGNVLSLMLIAFAVGIAIAKMPDSEGKSILNKGLVAAQEVLFTLIRWLIWTLPLGILAFSEQLTAQMSSSKALESLGTYVAVILCGNLAQMFVVLPLYLLARGLNPVKVFKKMLPAVLMASSPRARRPPCRSLCRVPSCA